eukprot:15466096-Alexandrium_andersonii.AAC.2
MPPPLPTLVAPVPPDGRAGLAGMPIENGLHGLPLLWPHVPGPPSREKPLHKHIGLWLQAHRLGRGNGGSNTPRPGRGRV